MQTSYDRIAVALVKLPADKREPVLHKLLGHYADLDRLRRLAFTVPTSGGREPSNGPVLPTAGGLHEWTRVWKQANEDLEAALETVGVDRDWRTAPTPAVTARAG